MLSEKLKKLRTERGLSRSDLAKATGIAASSIANYERGDRQPDADYIARLCRFFDVSADYMIGLADATGTAQLPVGPAREGGLRLLDAVSDMIASEARSDYERDVLGHVADIIERIGGLIADADAAFAELKEQYPAFSRLDPYGSMGFNVKTMTDAVLGMTSMPCGLEEFLAAYRERALDVTKTAHNDALFVQQRLEVAICGALTGGFHERVDPVPQLHDRSQTKNIIGGEEDGNGHKTGK